MVEGRQMRAFPVHRIYSARSSTMTSYVTPAVVIIILYLCQTEVQGYDCVVEDLEVKSNFDPTKFQGWWYEIKWIIEPWIPKEWNYHDYVADFTPALDQGYVINSHGRYPATAETCKKGRNSLFSTDRSARYLYQRKYKNGTYFNSTFLIADTDYENYALTVGCRNVNSTGQCTEQDGWLWTRVPKPDSKYVKLMEDLLPKYCLSLDQFITTFQNKECVDRTVRSKAAAFTSSSVLAVLAAVILLFSASFDNVTL